MTIMARSMVTGWCGAEAVAEKITSYPQDRREGEGEGDEGGRGRRKREEEDPASCSLQHYLQDMKLTQPSTNE